jgi:hypothetical protein
MLRLTFFVVAALVTAAEQDPRPLLLAPREQLDVPGKGEPEYTDAEAAAFATRLQVIYADRDRRPLKSLKETLAKLKIDPKKMRGGGVLIGNAKDWVEYRLSPNHTLSAAYTQGAPKETAFRDVQIIKAEKLK